MITKEKALKKKYALPKNSFLEGVGVLFDFDSNAWVERTMDIRSKSTNEAIWGDGQAIKRDFLKVYITEINK